VKGQGRETQGRASPGGWSGGAEGSWGRAGEAVRLPQAPHPTLHATVQPSSARACRPHHLSQPCCSTPACPSPCPPPPGARVPLQCAIDLLGNVYNFQAPADLGLEPLTTTNLPAFSRPATTAPPTSARVPRTPRGAAEAAAAAAAAAATVTGGPRVGWGGGPPGGGGGGGVRGAVQGMLVAGPSGPAVDLDQLLAFLVLEYCAGEDRRGGGQEERGGGRRGGGQEARGGEGRGGTGRWQQLGESRMERG
jgi:hypothetical protein